MSGHSHWATIKHKKAAADNKRGKVFTKIIKEITVATRVSGGDAAANPRLRLLLDKARSVNMPQENIIRAIKKGTGELPGVSYEAHVYEGYGPGNIAILVEVLTDNRNKAIADVRHAFSRNGGRIAEAGSVAWMFERAGVVYITGNTTEDALLESLIDYPINDISQEENTFIVTCEPSALEQVKQTISTMGLTITEAELEWIPKNTLAVSPEDLEKAVEFLTILEELEEVQNVYTNME